MSAVSLGLPMREVNRLTIIEAVTDARLKPGKAAERLELSVRKVERLVARYRAAGVPTIKIGYSGGLDFGFPIEAISRRCPSI